VAPILDPRTSPRPMVEIIRATEMGFCMGVRRAVTLMEEAAAGGNQLFSYGEIVHNSRVVERLEAAGIRRLPGPDAAEGDPDQAFQLGVAGNRLAITAHGVAQDVIENLERSGAEIIDTTCPIVTRAQRYAEKFVREGRHVLIFGDPGHKEVRGIVGWANDPHGRSQATVVERCDRDSLRALVNEFPDGFPSRIGVMAQTTHKVEEFGRFVSGLMGIQRDVNFDLHVVNTLCHATTGQQEAAAVLARSVDVMVVVGGRNSANTRHLREVCLEQGTPTHHIESAGEILAGWFVGASRIGITAGASTPDESVDEVEVQIRELLDE
jgi:4-hydroxy-3-methylbut-2-en-1-yl diphosphate reductase